MIINIIKLLFEEDLKRNNININYSTTTKTKTTQAKLWGIFF